MNLLVRVRSGSVGDAVKGSEDERDCLDTCGGGSGSSQSDRGVLTALAQSAGCIAKCMTLRRQIEGHHGESCPKRPWHLRGSDPRLAARSWVCGTKEGLLMEPWKTDPLQIFARKHGTHYTSVNTRSYNYSTTQVNTSPVQRSLPQAVQSIEF